MQLEHPLVLVMLDWRSKMFDISAKIDIIMCIKK